MNLIIIIIFILLFILSLLIQNKIYKQKYKFNYIAQLQSELQSITDDYANRAIAIKEEYNAKQLALHDDYITKQQEVNDQITSWREQQEAQYNSQLSQKCEQIDQLEKDFQTQTNNFQERLTLQKQLMLRVLDEGAMAYTKEAEFLREETERELDSIKIQLAKSQLELIDQQNKIRAVNEEIIRRRQMEEQEDFYKIQLDEPSLHDIALLNTIRNQLHKQSNLDKLIYDTYISKSASEMVKRVLEGTAPCGIYKITRLKTGEQYVGKSTDIKARWIQHVKSAFHCGTISHSLLHITMERDGIQNFTFELLEEVPKDQLSEREKYWIDFYQTKQYGLNERQG